MFKLFLKKILFVYTPWPIRRHFLRWLYNKSPVTTKTCKNKSCIKKCFNVRWQVFVEETKIVKKPERGKVEKDDYDQNSSHILALKDKKAIGTTRLIFNSEIGFRAEKIFGDIFFSEEIERSKVVEISRLSVLKSERGLSLATLKILKEAVLYAQKNDIQYFIAAFDLRLLKLFRYINFTEYSILGEKKESLGVYVVPLRFQISAVKNKLEEVCPDLK